MQCRDVREMAESFVSEELLVETNHEVVRHLEECPECRNEIATVRELRARTRKAFMDAGELRMAGGFSSDVSEHLRTAALRQPWLQHLGARWMAAAGTVSAAAVLLLLANATLTALTRGAVGDHRNCAVRFQLPEKPIALADAARFDGAYRLLQLSPPDEVDTPAGPVRVVERHSCVFDGRRFAHIVLQFQGRLVSLLVTADDGWASTIVSRTGLPSHLPWLQRADGYGIASFGAPGHVIFVVSDLEGRQLSEVAAPLADLVSRGLAGA